MTAAEEGVLLLCCRLGDPNSKPLAQFRDLSLRVRASKMDGNPLSEVSAFDLCKLGYTKDEAHRIISLLDREPMLRQYLADSEAHGSVPIVRISPFYPRCIALHRKFSSPPILFAKGDLSLLEQPTVAVVGSRNLMPENAAFAADAGRIAAQEGLVLVSGGAIGADQTAQRACLEAGGSCILVVPDRLADSPSHPKCLYLSEDGYDLPFSPVRALHRNSLIHMLGDKTIAAQCTYGKGGTWDGCTDNLKHNWSPLFVFEDGTTGAAALIERGATGVHRLKSILQLQAKQTTLF